jgi:hypothetical protein
MDQERIAAAVVARVTYRVVDGRLLLDPEQAWTIDKAEYESPVGPLPPEDCFRRGGVDLLIFGSARAPGGRATPKVEVRFSVGDVVVGVDVYGERLWTSGFGTQLRPSAPAAFVERPLSLAYAYGGTQPWDGLEVPFMSNPEGKGFYTEAANARGQPLPNIEDPRRPIQAWSDQPDPVGVGLCPRGFGPRVQRSVSFDERGLLNELRPSFFNEAFPDMVVSEVTSGAVCRVYGVREDAPLAFRVPTLPLCAHIDIGDTHVERLLQIDQIGVEPDLSRVFVTYRFPFRYTVTRMQPRACLLRWSTQAHEG